ncbi:putative Nodulation protein V [Candidatus Terasakiella magnetica]|nr:putative Nodulation protein V [Candidatus Terasakiella magnetica]
MTGMGGARQRITTATGILLATIWSTIGIWSITERSRMLATAETHLEQLTSVVEEQTLRLFKTTEVSLIAVNEWLATHPDPSPNTTPAFVQLVDQLRRLSDGLMDIRTVSPTGDLHLIPDPRGQSVGNIMDRESIVAQRDPNIRGFFIGQPVISPADDKWVIPVTFPVDRGGHDDVAIIAGVLDLKRVVALFEVQRLKPNGSITIIRSDGVSLFRAPLIEGIIGRAITNSPDFIDQFSKKERGVYRIDGIYDGVNRIVSFATLKRYNLIIAVTVPTEDALVHWRRDSVLLSVAGFFATILCILFAVQMGKSMAIREQAQVRLANQSARLKIELAERKEAEHALRQSEVKLQALFTQAPLGIWMLDHDGRIIECNDKFVEYAGSSRAEIIGFNQFTDARDQCLSAPLRHAMTGETVSIETDYSSTTGNTTSCYHYVFKPVAIDGNFAFLLCFAEDVGERKRMETAIREGKLRYDELVCSISVGVYTFRTHADGLSKFEFVSPRFCQILDLDQQVVLNDPNIAFRTAHPEERKDLGQAIQTALSQRQPLRWEGRFIIRGEIRWIHIESDPAQTANGEWQWNGVVSDITANKTLEIALRRSNAELEQFAYVASHDLREPLRMISSYMALLERRYGGKLDADAIEFLSFAKDGAVRMDRLVQDLLEFSRIGRIAETPSPVTIDKVVQTVLRSLSLAIEECGAQIHVTPHLPEILCRSSEITRLFQNLITNALKYRDATRRPEITISASAQDGGWLFSISDNGIGIDPDYSDRIFGIFQRLHTREKYEGTGIGLAICKKIVEHHGGHIWVESQPGHGSTFHFTLSALSDQG